MPFKASLNRLHLLLTAPLITFLLSSCASTSEPQEPIDHVARAHNCQVATANLQALANNHIITRRDASGKEIELNETEKKQAVKHNKKMKRENC